MSSALGTYRAVVADRQDPLGQGRVRLLIPQIFGTTMTDWAEATVPNSEVPALSASVWVLFNGGDVNRPIYMSGPAPVVSPDAFSAVTAWGAEVDLLHDALNSRGFWPDVAPLVGGSGVDTFISDLIRDVDNLYAGLHADGLYTGIIPANVTGTEDDVFNDLSDQVDVLLNGLRSRGYWSTPDDPTPEALDVRVTTQTSRVDALATTSTVTGTRLDTLESPARVFSLRATREVTGGGVIDITPTAFEVSWSFRFIVDSSGRGTTTAATGYFDITQPVVGTVIPGVGGSPGRTATANGVPLASWEALYYILPLASSGGACVAANFRIASDTAALDVPAHWVRVAFRNGDGDYSGSNLCDTVYFCNGAARTPVIAPTLLNSWVNYDTTPGYAQAGFYKNGQGEVFLSGLVKNGSLTVPIFTLPAGFRPGPRGGSIYPVVGNNAFARVDVNAVGDVGLSIGGNAFVNLGGISFMAGA